MRGLVRDRRIFQRYFKDFIKFSGEYQSGVNQFRATARKRESMRLKNQMNSAPGVLEKELMSKIQVEESVCQVCTGRFPSVEQKPSKYIFVGHC